MCRNNLIIILIWFSVSIIAGAYLGGLINQLFFILSFWAKVLINFLCIALVALFTLPFLDRFTS